jgi:hypothetical protein
MSNYAAPGARVGLQVDGSVTITGGLVIDMSDPNWPGRDAGEPASDEDREMTAVQESPFNVAGGNDVVGVQAGTVTRDLDES